MTDRALDHVSIEDSDDNLAPKRFLIISLSRLLNDQFPLLFIYLFFLFLFRAFCWMSQDLCYKEINEN